MTEKTYEIEKASEKREPWPKSIFFIISNEFCERFTFYGMRTVLVLYFTTILKYSDDTATQAFHIFAMACYFTPVIGAIIADSLLGKFWTILSISCIYALGSIILAIAAIDGGVAMTFIGLGLIAFGTGGIKPCVSAFGGDQFKPSQAAQLATFFSMFYVSINAGSLISTTITPILRSEVHCFDATSCFPLAFGVPAILMIVALGLFILGKFLTDYVVVPPGKGNVLVTVFRIVFYSLTNRKGAKRVHWLDYADDKYEPKTISEVRTVLQILYLYIPLPIFWALFDQQSSRWTLQAVKMNGNIGSFAIKPDQIQVCNPLLVIGLVPVFEYFIYPALEKFTSFNRPLRKMVIGGLLAALSFVVCGFFQIAIEANLPNALTSGNSHLFFINNLNCDVKMLGYDIPATSSPNLMENIKFELPESVKIEIAQTTTDCPAGTHELVPTLKADSNIESYIFYLSKEIFSTNKLPVQGFRNAIEKPESGGANMFTIFAIENFDVNAIFYSDGVEKALNLNNETFSKLGALTFGKIDEYEVSVKNDLIKMSVTTGDTTKEFAELDLKQGAGYVAVITGQISDLKVAYKEIVKPNSISVFWQIIQYFIISSGEIMFSITGLEFSYSQAPKSMKSVIQACWLLTVAFGNLLVAIIAELSIFSSQSGEFFFFAVLMAIDMAIFAVMAYYYKPIKHDDESAYASTNDNELATIDKVVEQAD